MEDRYDIMQWRNEQIYHLRQAEPLTEARQDAYFEEIISALFDKEQPSQILFSFLKGDTCIGYGGLVHINWVDKNAEISFIMKTELETFHFQENWKVYLGLIEKVAFEDLRLHKIFTFAFDVRPHLYPALEEAGLKREAVLPEHCLFDGQFLSVVIHGKINRGIELQEATRGDAEITFQWANNPDVRRYALTQDKIHKAGHLEWFENKITNANCLYYIAVYNKAIVGSFRLDIIAESIAIISYLIDPAYHGMGLGKSLLIEGVEKARADERIDGVVGYVKPENEASLYLFRKLGFIEKLEQNGLLKFELNVK
jgi:RimJ/RimL family protein N-acetyltransferase